jgi:hypothetical protein
MTDLLYSNTGVIQEPSERKKVVKSEVMKVNIEAFTDLKFH